VWLALAQQGAPTHAERVRFDGDRRAVREQTVRKALAMLRDAIRA
jgi:nicotinamide mononucleotide (NMN) deamidase PncC